MQTETASDKIGVGVQPEQERSGQRAASERIEDVGGSGGGVEAGVDVDLDKVYARAYAGGTALLAPTVETVGSITRYGAAIPVATAGVSSRTDLRAALDRHDHDPRHVRFALDNRLSGERAASAVRIAEENASNGDGQ